MRRASTRGAFYTPDWGRGWERMKTFWEVRLLSSRTVLALKEREKATPKHRKRKRKTEGGRVSKEPGPKFPLNLCSQPTEPVLGNRRVEFKGHALRAFPRSVRKQRAINQAPPRRAGGVTASVQTPKNCHVLTFCLKYTSSTWERSTST